MILQLFLYDLSLSGTFAVVSIMVGKTVSTYSTEFSSSDLAKNAGYSPTEVATLLCFLVGMIQVPNLLLIIVNNHWHMYNDDFYS